MSQKSLDSLMRVLSAKIKTKQVSQASWGGKKSFKAPSSNFNKRPNLDPSVDYFLNSASQLDRQQKSKQKMIEEYLQKQKVPIMVEGKEYKFHNIPRPELDVDEISIEFPILPTNKREIAQEPEEFEYAGFEQYGPQQAIPVEREEEEEEELQEEVEKGLSSKEKKEFEKLMKEIEDFREPIASEPLNYNEIRQLLKEKNIYIAEWQSYLNSRVQKTNKLIKMVEKQLKIGETYNNELLARSSELETILRNLPVEGSAESKGEELQRTMGDEINDELDAIDEELARLRQSKREMNELIIGLKEISIIFQNEKIQMLENIKTLIAEAENITRKYTNQIKEYTSELKRINNGAFESSQLPTETDQEYLERLERMADIPIDNEINENLAYLDQKMELQDKLLEITRDKTVIDQVLNELSSREDKSIFFEFNKIFQRFKEIFLKKYGYDNKNIRYTDIIQLFMTLLSTQDEQRLVPINPGAQSSQQYKPDSSTTVEFEDIYDPEQKFLSSQPLLSSFSSNNPLYEEEVLIGVPGGKKQKPKIYKDQPLIVVPVDNETFKLVKINPETGQPYDGNQFKLFIKYKTGEHEAINIKDGKKIKIKGKDILVSNSGDNQSYRSIGKLTSKNPIQKLTNELGIDKNTLADYFGLAKNIMPNDFIQILFNKMQENLDNPILPSSKQSILFETYNPELKTYIIGEGLSHEKKDKKIKFGDVVIMPNKLFYDNILSISRPDGVKINGFKNRHVSDDFVVVVVKMFENRNDYQKELNNLSSTERILLDNLLKLANLHKKVVTGTGSQSIDKLKNELQILEGQIQAGNNNESLKKKLHDILYKLAHFKVISISQANKHYKEYINNFF